MRTGRNAVAGVTKAIPVCIGVVHPAGPDVRVQWVTVFCVRYSVSVVIAITDVAFPVPVRVGQVIGGELWTVVVGVGYVAYGLCTVFNGFIGITQAVAIPVRIVSIDRLIGVSDRWAVIVGIRNAVFVGIGSIGEGIDGHHILSRSSLIVRYREGYLIGTCREGSGNYRPRGAVDTPVPPVGYDGTVFVRRSVADQVNRQRCFPRGGTGRSACNGRNICLGIYRNYYPIGGGSPSIVRDR